MKTKPAISVLLPVYNAAKYLPACLESILGQTFSDFELIIVEDGSTDESLEIIKSFRDSRIRLLENEVNQGPSASMNRAIAAASGTFIARMDADDIALPQRLEKQYAFFKEHPDYALLGTNMEFFGQRSLLFPLQYYTYFDDESLKLRAFFYTPLAQPSMMVRTAVLQQFPYREDFYTAEDYDLFVRVLATYKATSLEEKLVRYRVHQKNISKLKKTQTLRNLKEVYALKFRLEGVTVSAKDFEAHLLIPPANYSDLSLTDMQRIEQWLLKLFDVLVNEKSYDLKKVEAVFAEVWYRVGERAKVHGWQTYQIYRKSPLFAYHKYYFRSPKSLLLRCLLSKLKKLLDYWTLGQNKPLRH